MVLDSEKLESVISDAMEFISHELYIANRSNDIENVLKKYHLEHLLSTAYEYYDRRDAKIIVIGQSQLNPSQMRLRIKKAGVKDEDVEIIDDYEKMTNIDFSFLKNSSKYSDVLIGPMPHKVKGIDGFSSLIALIENNPSEYPKLIKLETNGELKITKTSLDEAISKTRYIEDRCI